MKIAGCKTVKQWEELNITLENSNNAGWDWAFQFFEERMETRYLKPIDAMIEMKDYKGEGFAVVNLQCSLIETIECFINGWVFNPVTNGEKDNKWYQGETIAEFRDQGPLKNVNIFESFFSKRSPFNLLNVDGGDFYGSVRCGLLHETQTKNGWKIRFNNKSEERSIVGKIIYRKNLHSDLRKLIKEYRSAIVDGHDFDKISKEKLRQNFRDKFCHICKVS